MKTFVSTLTVFLSMACAHAGGVVPTKDVSIVIVHGAFAGGAGWDRVKDILTGHGYNVTLVQNATVSLTDDVAATQKALAKQNGAEGSVVLVGHSYGGAVITQAGDDPKVKSLVYVAAYVPDVGDSLHSLLEKADPSAQGPTILGPINGTLFLDPATFPKSFAADLDLLQAQYMAATQVPLGVQAVSEAVTAAAWRKLPSYYIVSSDDHMIPPSDEKWMAKRATRDKSDQVKEIKASHAVFISHPEEVAAVIEQAATK